MDLTIPDKSFLLLIIARRKSGKTHLIIELLTNPKYLAKKFDKIIIISPTLEFDTTWINSSIDFDASNIDVYDVFDQELLSSIINSQTQHLINYGKENTDEILLILDDCISEQSTKMRSGNGLTKISNNGRHLNISIILTAQRVTGIIPDIRSQFDSMIVFHTDSKRELENLKQDINISDEMIICNTREDFSFINFLKVTGGKTEVYDSKNKRIQVNDLLF